MFQVEPILWLQSVMPGVLSWLLYIITELGRAPMYIAALFILAFGYRLRAGLALLILLALNGAVTETLKEGFGLPRPRHVEASVEWPYADEPVASFVDDGGAPDFWSLPTREAIETTRQQDVNFGLPSGHVSSAVAFAVGLALFFRVGWAWFLAGAWIPLMMLSRMFMGAHFLGDVLGGLAVGWISVGLAWWLLGRLRDDREPEPRLRDLTRLAIVALAILIAGPFIEFIDPLNAGRLVGLVAAYAFLIWLGMPRDDGTILGRAGRIAIVVALYAVSELGLRWLLGAVGLGELRVGELLVPTIGLVATMAIGMTLALRLGWYRDGEPPEPEPS